MHYGRPWRRSNTYKQMLILRRVNISRRSMPTRWRSVSFVLVSGAGCLVALFAAHIWVH